MKAVMGSNSVKKKAVILTKLACPSNCPCEEKGAEVPINVWL